ncbi:MAG TPA: hypothetical protein VKP58_14540 [Candidatus Acidoferrum sp.]|nr:hypothetical protein [Candidatus Acidoferrum sp.]
MRLRSIAAKYFLVALSVCATHSAAAQQKSLTRTFVAGAEERYQVTASIRVETRGVSTEKIGEKTVATFYTHEAQGQIGWRATRQIATVLPDSSAAIAESLDRFELSCDGDPGAKNFDATLQKSVHDACADWRTDSPMHYEEEKFGLIRGLPALANQIAGPDSPLLPLWIRRAFRPSVVLPRTPIDFGAPTTRKVQPNSGGEGNLKGQEAIEWLTSADETPSAVLHVSQDLEWIDPPPKPGFGSVGGKPSARQFFYADSLTTISLLDGSLLKASRSATRETKELLDPEPSLPDPPLFSSKLTITVAIQRLP